MVASVDGRTLTRPWRPQEAHQRGLFDRLHERPGSDAWLVGRVTDQNTQGWALIPTTLSRAIRGNPGSPAVVALDILNRELGVKRLLLEGGVIANGSFLRAGLIDEISLAIFPAVDGTKGAPCVFDSNNEEGGVVWFRDRLQST